MVDRGDAGGHVGAQEVDQVGLRPEVRGAAQVELSPVLPWCGDGSRGVGGD